MVPRMANTFVNGDKQQLKKYMDSSFKFVYFLAFPIMIGLLCISAKFVPVFFGDGYDKVIILINIISPIILFIGISNVLGTQYLLPTKKQKSFTISVTAGAIINFILNLFFIQRFGAVGASIATVIAEATVAVIQIISIRKDFEIRDFIVLAKNNLLAAIVMIIPTLILGHIIKSPIISVIIQIGVGALTYVGCLFILKDEMIISTLEKIKKGKFGKWKKLNS